MYKRLVKSHGQVAQSLLNLLQAVCLFSLKSVYQHLNMFTETAARISSRPIIQVSLHRCHYKAVSCLWLVSRMHDAERP
jgi:hypothetical protein